MAAKADPFAKLVAKTKSADSPKAAAVSKKPVLEFKDDEARTVDSLCAADAVYKICEGHQKAAKASTLPMLKRRLCELWADQRRRTENPIVQTGQSRANFIIKEVLKFELGENDTVEKVLVSRGFDPNQAKKIADNEVKEEIRLDIVSPTKLRDGSEKEQEVVNKLLQLVCDNFEQDELDILLSKTNKVSVQEGFLDRAVGYCQDEKGHVSAEQLETLLGVIAPQWVISHMVYNGKLDEAAGGFMRTEPMKIAPVRKEFTDAEKLYKAVSMGNSVELFLTQGSKETSLGVNNKCNDAHHAENLAKLIIRDSDARNNFIKKSSN